MTHPDALVLYETKHPDQPLIFTLDGDTFSMDIRAVFSHQALETTDPHPDPWEDRLEAIAEKMVRYFVTPVHVKDVTFLVQGEQVIIMLWKRTRGLRLAPATIALSSIDNPQAAADFATLIQERAAASRHPGKYTGLLDYWGSWVLMGLGAASALVSLGWWLNRRCDSKRS